MKSVPEMTLLNRKVCLVSLILRPSLNAFETVKAYAHQCN